MERLAQSPCMSYHVMRALHIEGLAYRGPCMLNHTQKLRIEHSVPQWHRVVRAVDGENSVC